MKMLNKILTLSLLSFLFIACNQGKVDSLEAEKNRLEEELKAQKQLNDLKDSTISDFFEAIADIEGNLEQVRNAEMDISSMRVNGDVPKSSQDRILDDITLISELLGENKKTINRLNELMAKSNIKSKKLTESIAKLEKRILEKDEQIGRLTTNLSNANTALSALNQIYMSKVQEAETLDEQLHTAYYAFGTFKELKNNNVLSKEGSFIGIGGAKTLSDDFNKDYFKKINTLATNSIALYTQKDVELATEHPSESYIIETENDSKVLTIKDSDKFWSVSKYLVVITK